MHPIITAWLEYKRVADVQVSYYNKRTYAAWIGLCKAKFEWLKELGFVR